MTGVSRTLPSHRSVSRTRHTLRDRAALLLAAVVALGTLAWLATPFAEVLMQWFLD